MQDATNTNTQLNNLIEIIRIWYTILCYKEIGLLYFVRRNQINLCNKLNKYKIIALIIARSIFTTIGIIFY